MPFSRRYDMDWLRIAAFAALTLYHVGMFYVTWDWHVKSRHSSPAIEPLMMLVNPWRLTLLFLISGAATRFMADKMSAWKLTGERMARLWPPLLLAFFVIVPPQSYYEIVSASRDLGAAAVGAPQNAWLDNFYQKYVTGSGHWCDADGCLTTPTYNHMWFVAYLIIYTLVLIPLMPPLRRIPKAVSVLIAGPGLILTPWLFLFATRITLFPIFGETHDFREDWYLHVLYLTTFLFGFGIAKYEPFFEHCVRWRWAALALALSAWAAIVLFYGAYPEVAAPPPDWLRAIFRGVHEMQAWTAIVAAIGFAHRHLQNSDGPVRRYFTEAIFPYYLVHQTLIVVIAYHLDRLGWPLWIEAPLLIFATVAGCALTYEIARRAPVLRPWFGLKPPPKRGPALAGAATARAETP